MAEVRAWIRTPDACTAKMVSLSTEIIILISKYERTMFMVHILVHSAHICSVFGRSIYDY